MASLDAQSGKLLQVWNSLCSDRVGLMEPKSWGRASGAAVPAPAPSSSPTLLGGDVLAQGGKEALIRLLSIKAIGGPAAHVNHELQTVPTDYSEQGD